MSDKGDGVSRDVTLPTPCTECESTSGHLRSNGPHTELRCSDCGKHIRFVPKSETGEPHRSVRSSSVPSKQRTSIFARHNNECISCGRSPIRHGINLQLDHIIPVEAAKRHGVYDEFIESHWNLAPLCEECNLGKSDDIGLVPVTLMYRVLMMKAMPRDGEAA